jgi:hypothetical protein
MDIIEFVYDRIGDLGLGATSFLVGALAIAFRWDLGLNAACLTVGRRLSTETVGTGFQDALTPPWRTKLALTLWAIVFIVFLAAFSSFGFEVGAALVALFVLVSVLTGALLIPAPESRHYLRIIFHALVNRLADFRRDGDEFREKAASVLVDQMMIAYPDLLGPTRLRTGK